MGALVPSIKVYESDGTTLVGTIENWIAITWTLGARLGCRGGQLRLPGDARTEFFFSQDQIVFVYYEPGVPIYAGRIDGPQRTIEGQEHVYTLRSPFADLEKIDMGERVVLGANSDVADTGTVGEIIQWLYTNRIAPGTIFELGDIACDVPVDLFILEPGTDLPKRLEDLELIASSDGQKWCCGITPELEFYFTAIPDADTVSPIEYEIGSESAPVFAGTQELRGRYVGNNLAVIGARGVTPDESVRTFKKIFNASSGDAWAASAARWKQSRLRYIAASSLGTDADMTRFADGWLARYGNPRLKLDNMFKAYSGDLETGQRPTFPWEALGVYTDTQRGQLEAPDVISAMEFELSTGGFSARAVVGFQEEPGSDYAPSRDRDIAEDYQSTLYSGYEFLPEATDLFDAPDYAYQEIPSGSGGGGDVTPGPEAVGLAVLDLMPGSGYRAGDGVGGRAKLSPGDYEEEELYVLFIYKQYNLEATEIGSGAVEGVLSFTDSNGYQVWGANGAYTTQGQDGYLFIGVSVVGTKDMVAKTIHYPADVSTNPGQGALIVLHLGEGDIVQTTMTIYTGGLVDGG